MLIEIHIMQNHAPSNLNRDDTGSPKSCLFGGIRRSRISSQCLKRAIRNSEYFQNAMKSHGIGIRTRQMPLLIKKKLIEIGISEEFATEAAKKATGFGNKEGKERDEFITAQVMFFSNADLDNIVNIMKERIKSCGSIEKFKKITPKDLQNDLHTQKIIPISPDIALFGRMITSNAFRNIEASTQVAHAISTNRFEHEFDFFTAIDDEKSEDQTMKDQGAGMMGDIEYNSATYYKYFSFDRENFLKNMNHTKMNEEAKLLLSDTITAFIEAAVFTSPSGKQNSFAAHQLPSSILVEIRPNATPISYANAFIKPIKPNHSGDLVENSVKAFIDHVKKINEKYPLKSIARFWFSADDIEMNDVSICENFSVLLKKISKIITED